MLSLLYECYVYLTSAKSILRVPSLPRVLNLPYESYLDAPLGPAADAPDLFQEHLMLLIFLLLSIYSAYAQYLVTHAQYVFAQIQFWNLIEW